MNTRRYGLLLLFMLCNCYSFAQTIKQIGILDIQPTVVELDATVRTVEILSSKNQSAGKFRGADVMSCLKNLINAITPDNRSKTVIIAKNNYGQQLVFSLPELLPEVSKIPPILVYRKVTGELGDTAHISDAPRQTGRVNVKEIDAYLERAVQEKIKLQIPDVKNVAFFLRQPVSLIFPTDSTAARWLGDVAMLIVAVIE